MLVFLGGILVVFVYIRGLASYVKVEVFFYYIKVIFLVLVAISLIIKLREVKINFVNCARLLIEDDRELYILISSNVFILYMFSIGYLLITLFIVCKIVEFKKGPLRQLF